MPTSRARIRELSEERARVATQMREMVTTAESEDRGLTPEERTTWEQMSAQVDTLQERIDTLTRSADVDDDLGTLDDDGIGRENRGAQRGRDDDRDPDDDDQGSLADIMDNRDYQRAFNALIRSSDVGTLSLTEHQRNALRMVQRDPRFAELRAQATTPGSAGGFLIPREMSRTVVETMAQFGGLFGAAQGAGGPTLLRTSTGNEIGFPTNDDTGNSGVLLAENTQDAEEDLVFGEAVLNAFKYSSRIIRVSVELLQDSAVNLDQFIGRKFGQRLGRATAAHFATGTGSAQPQGLNSAATTGKTAASATAITYLELLDLKHSVDPAYRQNARWVFHDSTLLALKKLVDSNGLPLWQPNVQQGEAALLDGDGYVVDQGWPAMTTGNDSVTYGDLSQFYIREVLGITMSRLVERYADYHQVGFVAIGRWDSELMDAAAVRNLTQA